MDFTFFDTSGDALFVRADAIKAEWTQDQLELKAEFPLDGKKPLQRMQRVGFRDGTGVFQVFEIFKAQTDLPAHKQTLTATQLAPAELRDYVLGTFTPTDTTPASALTQALTGTGWQVCTVTATGTASCEATHEDVWTAVCAIRDAWGVTITPRVTFGPGGIAGKYLDISPSAAVEVGLRLSLERNLTKIQIVYDDSEVKTALYAYGKTTRADDVETQVDIGPAVWSTAAGDPADKPAGQLYIEDAAATAAYGRNGTPRFGVFEDAEYETPEALLAAAWDALEKIKQPKLSITCTVADLYAWGYTGEPLGLGYAAMVDVEGCKVKAKIIKYKQDLLFPEKSKITIGNYIADIVYRQSITSSQAQKGEAIANSNPSLLQGFLDTMVTSILSTGTTFYTEPSDGSLVFVSSDKAKAVRITGAGILLASQKVGGAWQWRTAITGQGMVADEITTGTLRASLVTILGNANFFWDAAAITCQNPQDPQQQIRFGLYDGTNYGIAFTNDGGQTWAQAINFTGVTATHLQAATGTFTGTLQGVDGTFSGELQAATGTFAGDISAANGTFTGTIYAKNIQVGDTAGYITGGQVGSRTITSGNLETVYATEAQFNQLSADIADIDSLLTGSADIDYLSVRSMGLYGGVGRRLSCRWTNLSSNPGVVLSGQ